MPSRDPSGRRLSGAAQRRQASTLPPLSRAARRAFAELGAPAEDADELLVWMRRVLATATHLIITGALDPARARSIKDLIAVGGMVHNRSVLEETVHRLREKLAIHSTVRTIKEVPGGSFEKPPTARGQRRGPRPLPPDEQK